MLDADGSERRLGHDELIRGRVQVEFNRRGDDDRRRRRGLGGGLVDIDMTALRGLESEKDISLELVVKAIEEALLIAYHRTEGAAAKARVELDRKTGHVTVWATETDEEGSGVRGVRRHARPISAGSRRPPRNRSSCSTCATPRTS